MNNSISFGAFAALVGGVGAMAATVPSSGQAEEPIAPAVRNLNAKLSFGHIASGDDDAPEGSYVAGAVSAPVTHSFGAQLDFGANNVDGPEGALDRAAGFGLHLFFRDPSRYLVGLYGHRLNVETDLGTARNTRVGIEGEAYLGALTLAGFVGRDIVEGAGQSDRYDAAEVNLDYYLSENTMLMATFEAAFEDQSVSLGVEHMYQLAVAPVSLSAAVGRYEDETTFSLGATVYFGNDGLSLKSIHRQNDPRIRLSASPTRSGYFDALREDKPVFVKPLPQ